MTDRWMQTQLVPSPCADHPLSSFACVPSSNLCRLFLHVSQLLAPPQGGRHGGACSSMALSSMVPARPWSYSSLVPARHRASGGACACARKLEPGCGIQTGQRHRTCQPSLLMPVDEGATATTEVGCIAAPGSKTPLHVLFLLHVHVLSASPMREDQPRLVCMSFSARACDVVSSNPADTVVNNAHVAAARLEGSCGVRIKPSWTLTSTTNTAGSYVAMIVISLPTRLSSKCPCLGYVCERL